MGVYSQAGETEAYNEILSNFDEEFSVAHLKLSASDTLRDLSNAITIPPNNYIIEVVFNTNNLNRPSLDVARTLIHELIHAEMFRKLMSLIQEPNLDNVTRQELTNLLSNGDFPGIYDYYRRYTTNWSHQQMANHYRQTIADMLQEFDNYKHPYDFYMDLAWEGLMYSDISIWNNKSASEKTRIKNVILGYIANNKYQGCQ